MSITPVSYCLSRGQVNCIYSEQLRNSLKRLQGRSLTKSTSTAAVDHSVVSLQRYRMGASTATGLVGTEENVLLREFFKCLGFAPFTSPSEIRGAMVDILSSRWSNQAVGQCAVSSRRDHSRDEGCTAPVCASSRALASIFWCAVAMGGLLQGRSETLVARYVRRAEDAFAACQGNTIVETARAYGMMSILYSFLARDEDDVAAYLQRRVKIIGQLEPGESREMLREGFAMYAQHAPSGEDMANSFGDAAEFLSVPEAPSAEPVVQVTDFSEEGLHAYIALLGRAILVSILSVVKKTAAVMLTVEMGERKFECARDSSDEDGSPVRSSDLPEPRDPEPYACPTRYASLRALVHEHSDGIERLRQATRRSSCRWGLTIPMHCMVILASVARSDRPRVIESVYHCADAFIRYPGLGRFILYHSIYATITLVIASLGDHVKYEKVAASFNSLRVNGMPPIPPLEERLQHFLCDHVLCRVEEQYLREHGWGPLISPFLHVPCRGLGYGNQRTTPSHGREADHYNGAGAESCRGTSCSTVARNTCAAPLGSMGKGINEVPDVIDANDWNYVESTFASSSVEPLRALSEDLMTPSTKGVHERLLRSW